MGMVERKSKCGDCVISRSCVLSEEGDNDSPKEDEASKVIEYDIELIIKSL